MSELPIKATASNPILKVGRTPIYDIEWQAALGYHLRQGCVIRGPAIRFLEKNVKKKYVRAYLAEPLERIALIRIGVQQADLMALAADLNIPVQTLRKYLHVRNGPGRCNAAASERILGLMALIGQVDTMVRRCHPDVKFSAAAWLGNWLSNPVGALGGIRPAAILDTMVGVTILSDLLKLPESGAFA